ncbi:hypothetical protein KR222_006461, partial [Zaprionus bogoriensis]
IHKMHIVCNFLCTFLSIASALPLLQDDMRLTYAQLAYLKGNVRSRNALTWSQYYWPQGRLIYSMAKEMTFSDTLRVQSAMRNISAQTCVSFRLTHDPKEPQVVIQRKSPGCWSNIGYLRTIQTVNLGVGCMPQGIIQHELLHALAMLHMQSDPSRDKYVRINYENIAEHQKHNFQIYRSTDFGIGYDYASIMHYGPYAFSINGKPTIFPNRRGVKIGQRIGLSSKDVLKLNRMYC